MQYVHGMDHVHQRRRYKPQQSTSNQTRSRAPRGGYNTPLATKTVLAAIFSDHPDHDLGALASSSSPTVTLNELESSSSLTVGAALNRTRPSLAAIPALPNYGVRKELEPPLLYHKSGTGLPNDSVVASSRPYVRGGV